MATDRYHHGNLRAALLDAGLRLAAARGPSAVQLREVATAEGVSPSAVYRHFPDLAHLSAEVARRARESLAQAMLDAAAALPPDTDPGSHAIRHFDAIGRAYVAFGVAQPHLFGMAFTASEAQPSCADSPSAWDVLNHALDALVSTGEMDAAMRGEAPVVAWSAVHGLAAILAGGMLTGGQAPDDATDTMLRGIRRALGIREADETP